jgi:hypothetical protein
MADFEPEIWDLHGGFYRNIDSATSRWVASPRREPKWIVPPDLNFKPTGFSRPFRLPDTPVQPSASKRRKRQNINFTQILRRLMCKSLFIVAPHPLTVWPATTKKQGKIRNAETKSMAQKPDEPWPQRVQLQEWKAWGYYAYPMVKFVRVRNHRYRPLFLFLREVAF